MRLKFLYSFLGYGLIALCFGFILVAGLVDFLQSLEFVVKTIMYLGIFASGYFILSYFRRRSKETVNLTLVFSVFGQLCIVFLVFIFGVYGYQGPQDVILSQEMEVIKNNDLNPELRIARCEQTFFKNKDRNSFLVSDIEMACGRMILDVARQSHLNVIPALGLVYKLEGLQNKQGTSALTPLRVCLIAESGEVDRAIRIADRDKLHSVSTSLRKSGHCKMFVQRDIASEM